jgi:hypothetical protein
MRARTCPYTRAVRVGFAGLVAGLAAAPVGSYPVVAHEGPVPVRAPTARYAWGACPSGAVGITRSHMAEAKLAVLAALPTIAKRSQPPLNLRGARVTVVRHTRRNGDIMPSRRSCAGTPFVRSVLVQVFLPAERTAPAIRGNPSFYVARTREGWVIWDEPH